VTGLLRKPGGFEGLLSVTEILPVNKAAVAIRRDPRRRHIRLDTALPRSDVERADREHPVPEVADVGVVEPKNIEALRRIGEELLIPLTSSVGARYGRSQRLENYIRINQLLGERNIEVTLFEGPFEGVDPAPKYFYVLARHHLLPQPGGFEGALGAITAALPARPQVAWAWKPQGAPSLLWNTNACTIAILLGPGSLPSPRPSVAPGLASEFATTSPSAGGRTAADQLPLCSAQASMFELVVLTHSISAELLRQLACSRPWCPS
jgi:hypothetical protein